MHPIDHTRFSYPYPLIPDPDPQPIPEYYECLANPSDVLQLERAIGKYRYERQDALVGKPHIRTILEQVEHEMTWISIESRFLPVFLEERNQNSREKSEQAKRRNEELKIKIAEYLRHIEEGVKGLKLIHSLLGPTPFEGFEKAITFERQIIPSQYGPFVYFATERCLHRCYQRLVFTERVRSDLNSKKQEIIKGLFPSYVARTEAVVFEPLLPERGETHNRGKIAIKVVVKIDDQIVGHLYYKPRNALLDRAAIAAFQEINALPKEARSREGWLAEYKILDFPGHSLLVNGRTDGEFSVWEYLEEPIEQDPPTVYNVWRSPRSHNPIYQPQRIQLERLEQIAKAMGLYDMHYENVFFSRAHGLAPIDLECVSLKAVATGLNLPHQVVTPLSAEEQEIVQRFRDLGARLPTRCVLVATGYWLTVAQHPSKIFTLADRILEDLGRAKLGAITLNINKALLIEYMIIDFLHGDVPYLTLNRNKVYYNDIQHPIAEFN